jgi:hypothetical protein
MVRLVRLRELVFQVRTELFNCTFVMVRPNALGIGRINVVFKDIAEVLVNEGAAVE